MTRHLRIAAAVLVASLSVASTATAQVQKTLGVRGGVAVASASLEDASETLDTDNRTGFAGTLFLNAGKGRFSLQPEVSYIQKGVKDADGGGETQFTYIEAAALLKAGLPLGIARAGLFGGIGADFESDCKIVEDGVETSCDDEEIDTKSPDWNAIFGLDVAVYVGGISLWGDGRYSVGLSDISDVESISYKNRAWIFSVGLGFEL